MPRAFVGIKLPEEVQEHLVLVQGGIPGARWEARDKLHLTLRFIGEVDGGVMRQAADALRTVQRPRFTLRLAGIGHFPPRGKPRSVWVGVENPVPVVDLHERIEHALAKVGLEPERRKFAPHVTLARLRDAPPRKVAEFMAHHALLKPAPFEVDSFQLFTSVRSPTGSKYRIEELFALEE